MAQQLRALVLSTHMAQPLVTAASRDLITIHTHTLKINLFKKTDLVATIPILKGVFE